MDFVRKPGRHNAPPVVHPPPPTANESQFRVTTRDPLVSGVGPMPEMAGPRNPFFRPVPTAEDIAAAVVRRAGARKRSGRMKLFVPQNAALYNAAFSGYVAGCNQARTIGSATTGLVSQAVFFAQAVDTDIPFDAALNQSKIDLLTAIVGNVFGELYPTGLDEADYSGTATEVVALYNEAVLLLAPVAPPSGGITQLTGDVAAGPGVGSQVATVEGLRGIALPAPSGANTVPTYNAGALTWATAGGSNGTTGSIIFKPGVASTGNTYETAAEVAAQLLLANGALTVFVDDTVAPAVIPNGVVWQCGFRATIAGHVIGNITSLEIQDGGQIRNPSITRTVNLLCDSQTLPSIDYDWTGTSLFNLGIVGSLVLSATATVAAIQIPPGNTLVVDVSEALSITSDEPTGLVPIIELETGGASVFFIITDLLTGSGAIAVQTVGGDATGTLAYFADATGWPMPSWTLFSGTLTQVMIDAADGVAYNDSSGPPTGAANVQSAIDIIKSFTQPLYPGGVIEPLDPSASFQVCGGTATGLLTAVLGESCSASGSYSGCIGGYSNAVDGTYSVTCGGYGNDVTVSSRYSCSLGGYTNTINALQSVTKGQFAITYPGTHDGALVTGCSPGGTSGLTPIQAVDSYVMAAYIALGDMTANFQNGISNGPLTLQDASNYSIEINAIANDDGSGSASWTFTVLVHTIGGIAIIDATSGGAFTPTTSVGSGATWTLTPNVSGADTILAWTITAPAPVASAITSGAVLNWIEKAYP